MPVMEGKSLLYKYLGGVGTASLLWSTPKSHQFISFVYAVQPGLGGVQL